MMLGASVVTATLFSLRPTEPAGFGPVEDVAALAHAVRGAPQMRLDWRFETGGPIHGGAATDSDGQVYIGSEDGYLYALSSSGGLRWKQPLGGPIFSAPVVDPSGQVIVGSDAGSLHGYSAAGTLRFVFDAGAPVDRGVVLDGPRQRVLFAAGVRLFAVSLDGRELFHTTVSEKIFSTPAVGPDGTVYFGSQNNLLYAVDGTGSARWTFATEGDVDSGPVLSEGGRIVFGSDDQHAYCVSTRGELLWKTHVGGMVRSAVGFSPTGHPVFGTLGARSRLVSLDVENGSLRWEFRVIPSPFYDVGILSAPRLDGNGTLFFGAHDDTLYALSGQGELKYVLKTEGDIVAPPVTLSSGSVVVGALDGRVYSAHPPKNTPPR